MENNIYFKESFVKKMLKLVPENLKKVWGFETTDFSKVSGGVRYDNNSLESIYLGDFVRYLEIDYETFVKFNFINGEFIFDSMYFKYDPITKEDISPYEKRYDKDFNVIATYKYNIKFDGYNYQINNKFDVNTSNPIFATQYKDGEKVKEYYPYDGEIPSKLFEELIKMKVLNRPHWMSGIKTSNILQNMWDKIMKLKNNKVKPLGISIECTIIKVYGNETLIYYWF